MASHIPISDYPYYLYQVGQIMVEMIILLDLRVSNILSLCPSRSNKMLDICPLTIVLGVEVLSTPVVSLLSISRARASSHVSGSDWFRIMLGRLFFCLKLSKI